jgi:hypothetical protein
MVGFVCSVATINLGVGYFLGWRFLRSRKAAYRRAISLSADGKRNPNKAKFPLKDVDTPSTPNHTAVVDKTERSAESARVHRLPMLKTAPTTWTIPKSWSDFGEQLQTVRERLRYARSASDKRLAKEVAVQLHACTQSWYSILQERLTAATSSTSGIDVGDLDSEQLEMCLAQIETTLTNIDSLVWTDAVDIILDKIDREADALDDNRRSAAASTRQGASTRQAAVASSPSRPMRLPHDEPSRATAGL